MSRIEKLLLIIFIDLALTVHTELSPSISMWIFWVGAFVVGLTFVLVPASNNEDDND